MAAKRTTKTHWGLSLLLTLAIAACQTQAPPQQVVDNEDAEEPVLISNCSPENDAKLTKTVDVLLDRGFTPRRTESFMQTASRLLYCPGEDTGWYRHFAERVPNYRREFFDFTGELIFDINTGRAYDYTDPVAVAKSLPACYASGEPYERCRPKYHPHYPIMLPKDKIADPNDPWNYAQACRLDANWKKFCSLATSMDACWSEAKSDMVIVPPTTKAQESRIQLARATRVDRMSDAAPAGPASEPAKASTPVKAKPKKVAKASTVPICHDLGWEYLLPK
ncbi:hypothetical protein HDIA_1017 [Hartmannibacter diazotrophicus]|uniref:Lipoprotein n=1 Tax=Hartmannibacter diazotrophicus TaxID=1482074 RepID=A0A2C9D322_9HYPH|nr:hypothetical protein [Hartmannibacter diazotrophicus]SON54558.1 hypothetical protein HDIA_1017 [Hartmannibacter diazotrophicus]